MSQKIKTISAPDAWQLCEKKPRTLLIDVRSSMEYLFVGHPKGAVHIPWIDEPDWIINKDFATEIRKLLLGGSSGSATEVAIVLVCRSGNRSAEAGLLLIEEGIKNIYNIEDGFEGKLDDSHHRSTLGGWRYHELPWEQC
jgi:rhodanese-related sulfurtransferase